MGISGVVVVRHERIDVVIDFLEIREAILELRIILDGGKTGLRGNAGIVRAHAQAIPAFLRVDHAAGGIEFRCGPFQPFSAAPAGTIRSAAPSSLWPVK